MHGPNRTHNTKDCFESVKHAKANRRCIKTGEVAYKDLNTFVNAKVAEVLKKAKKEQKEKKAKKVTINAFDKFRSLNVDSSSKESNHK
eukprot:2625040-Ditylum_brightwellii.AAC.1